MSDPESQGAAYEEQHVHSVYEQIASHFSSTRYKPWPIVERFLKELPDGAVGADVGCGNGKYLAVNPGVFIVGSDRFDFAISIAVIHHLSTPARRKEAVKAVLELLRRPLEGYPESGGRALIYVWALEQKDSRRGWDEGHDQDVMVPWVMKVKKEKDGKKGRSQKASVESNEDEQRPEQSQDKTFLRYYHLYRKGELEQDIVEAGGEVVEAGYEKDNWWAIAVRK
ncbi:tRNA methyltransferase, has a role in tRNA modification [Kalmusia sp. IMI 367209]|nr:tRNA methyltransferase, has a role in tRNA modification [Kalmusia sp. IMI 367209]